MKLKSEREVAQSCPTLSHPMDCSLPGSSVHGIFQARVLEWSATFMVMDGEIQAGPAGRDTSGKGVMAGEKAVGFVPGT